MGSEAREHRTYGRSYQDRSALPNTSILASHIFQLMAIKRTNLCLSADVSTTAELLDVAEECGDSICVLKTHADIITDFSERTIRELTSVAARKNFIIFEDRKFADIGNTVKSQYVSGVHRIASWASLVNAHILSGPTIIDALKSAALGAIVADHSQVATEISGGGPLPESLDSRLAQQLKEEEEDGEDEGDSALVSPSSDEEKPEVNKRFSQGAGMGHARSPDGLLVTKPSKRKSSVISVRTEISSSYEYVSAPGTATSTTFDNDFGRPVSMPAQQPTTIPPAPLSRGLLLLAQMSSKGNLLGSEYTRKCVELARADRDFVLGFIAQESLNSEPADNFLVLTPGVNLPPKSNAGQKGDVSHKVDALDQQYNTPHHVIVDKGVDVIIVGRGILNAEDRGKEAERYRQEGWSAYLERTTSKETTSMTKMAVR